LKSADWRNLSEFRVWMASFCSVANLTASISVANDFSLPFLFVFSACGRFEETFWDEING
jgi:hypothetical protein